MCAQVDALSAPVPSSNASATLAEVCYKPLGADCATQSILQVPGSCRLMPGSRRCPRGCT